MTESDNLMERKTINFEKVVLDKIEERAKKQGVNVSKFVNMICRVLVMRDAAYHKEMARQHNLKMQNHIYLADQAKILNGDGKIE